MDLSIPKKFGLSPSENNFESVYMYLLIQLICNSSFVYRFNPLSPHHNQLVFFCFLIFTYWRLR